MDGILTQLDKLDYKQFVEGFTIIVYVFEQYLK